MRINQFLLLLIAALIFSACSNTKYLAEGELLYTGASVKVKGDSLSSKSTAYFEENLEGLVRPRPNSSILGLRPKLWFYNIAGEPNKDKGFKYWLKNKMGEPPVLFSQVDMDYNTKLIQNYIENKGFFNAKTSADSSASGKKATSTYTVQLGARYIIDSVRFPNDSIPLTIDIKATEPNSLLKSGKPYDLEVIKTERDRIDAKLKEVGYFYFNPDFLLAQVDSTAGNHQVDIKMKVKDETPILAQRTFTIGNIYVYPDYSINKDTLAEDSSAAIYYKDLTILDPENKFKPSVFDRSLLFKKGELYNRTDHNKSLNRLVNLGTFKFVKNQFKPSDSIDGALDAYYYLTPLAKKSIRLELTGKTNSANYLGTDVTLSWRNRNALRGAELLTISASAGYEAQYSSNNSGFNIYRFGGEASLTWPRLITPFNLESSSAFIPKTVAKLSFDFQSRSQLYALESFKSSFGYQWKDNIRKEHQLNISEITYVRPFNVTDLYKDQIIQNPSLGRVIEEQLIFGPTYKYTYTNTMETTKTNTIFYQGSADLSGNIVGLVTGANAKDGNQKEVIGVPFSQYIKLENDFRHYLKLGPGKELASRIIVGAGIPYGNSTQLPFIKQFFVGGTNSIRAFRARTIGPGSYNFEVDDNSFLPDQSGDLKLELNTEFRADLFNIVEGALFVDAGNIWLLNEDEQKPGAAFSSDFLSELAVGTGVGLRFDLQFLILRTDLAFPIRVPYYEKGNRWVLDQVDFGNSQWRRDNLVFNLAIGYPF